MTKIFPLSFQAILRFEIATECFCQYFRLRAPFGKKLMLLQNRRCGSAYYQDQHKFELFQRNRPFFNEYLQFYSIIQKESHFRNKNKRGHPYTFPRLYRDYR